MQLCRVQIFPWHRNDLRKVPRVLEESAVRSASSSQSVLLDRIFDITCIELALQQPGSTPREEYHHAKRNGVDGTDDRNWAVSVCWAPVAEKNQEKDAKADCGG